MEQEEKITKEEYLLYLSEADSSLQSIKKIRTIFLHKNKCFELDEFPFSDDYALLEIELRDIREDIIFPDLEIIAEVTDDPKYKNNHLARYQKLESPSRL